MLETIEKHERRQTSPTRKKLPTDWKDKKTEENCVTTDREDATGIELGPTDKKTVGLAPSTAFTYF